ncbi:MAG: ATP-dependent DNA helicase [Lachnospiraceae bacterium]|nr:ATP-dependent DNA helicase [Lachnospiraceae bacterium]
MEIRVSVRQLVEFILREGSIDNRKSGGADTAMQEGGRIHRMLQRRMGSEYHAEIGLQYTWNTPEYDIIIEGRADGIIDYNWGEHDVAPHDVMSHEKTRVIDMENAVPCKELPARLKEEKVIIDEIKGTYRELRRITKPVGVHLAQAKCYAYMYAEENHLEHIGVRMTYCHIETEELKYFHEDYTFLELKRWFDDLMQEYRKWADFQFEWEGIRTASIRQLQFPFPYREGQKELVTYVYQTIYHKRKLFLEAPTGVGKTISTVFPAVKSMGEGMAEKIFYLTAKTITRTVAQECFSLLQENGLHMKAIILTAKDKICLMKQEEFQEENVLSERTNEAECNPDVCPYANGHFDRINDAMYDLLTHEEHFTRDKVLEYAVRHQVCPFEFSLDMSLFSDVIICDYNYVFDPRVYLKRFFADGIGKRNYVFLIDETHNLLDRGREMYSAALFKNSFLHTKRLMKEASPKVAKHLDKCNKELLAMKRQCENYRKEEGIDGFVVALNRLYGAIDDFLDEHDTFPNKKELLEFYFEVAHFLNMYEIMDDNYVMYSQLMDDGDFMLKLFCVDPSRNLRQCMQKGRSAILFSATLLPIQYYKKLLGGEPTDYEVYAKSTFDENKKALLIANDVTSKYARRSKEEFQRIARYIHEVVRQRHGNYMVFLPSHLFLEQVYNCFMETCYDADTMECIVQEDYMSEAKREEFLLRFQGNEGCALTDKINFEIEAADESILIGFCVMGGIFSEGIDLKHDSLIGAIIVGTGIPQVGCERQLLKEYFDAQGENGFDYAYRYPGMNKVLQSAGRVIRTAEDIGVVALLDERFLEQQYRRMFPREWSQYEVVNVSQISQKVENFWNEWL